ncbi:MAG: class I SAM-dependent methyltransferase [Myxococcota bacterium]|nr:class I SAM-dependent methyltransferase [Myxococcota bacterium]
MDEREFHDRFYETDAPDMFRAPMFMESFRRCNAYLIEHAVPAGDARILSLGCGEGHLELDLAPHVPHIMGVDLSPAAIAAAQRRAAKLGIDNVEFQVGDIRTMDFAAGSFDAIWAPAILHHIDAGMIELLVRKSRVWLRPGGLFCNIDPSSRRFINVFKGLFQKKYDRFHSPDERELDPEALLGVFRAAGYREIAVRHPDFFLNPLAWLFPKLPIPLVRLASTLDAFLATAPVVRSYSSSFSLVAVNPAG